MKEGDKVRASCNAIELLQGNEGVITKVLVSHTDQGLYLVDILGNGWYLEPSDFCKKIEDLFI